MPFDARTRPHDVPGAGRRRAVGRQEIITGDCLAELRAMPAGTVDVVVTSPPYNIGVAYRGRDDRMPRPAYLGWLGAIGAEIARVLKPDGSFLLNVGGTNADPWIADDVAAAFRDAFALQLIEPSARGGGTIARAIADFVTGHDFARCRSAAFARG